MKKEPLNQMLVREYIIACHGNLAMVKELLTKNPDLINSTVNWGGDDWESGLGAAAHTGNRDIALFLLEHGARMDLFTAAMLGELSIVKSIIEQFPFSIESKGAHGIPLIRHAQMGGEIALPVLEYLHAKETVK